MTSGSIKVSGIPELRRDLQGLQNLIKKGSRQIMSGAAKEIIRKIKIRTASGRDVNNSPFAGYNKDYKKQKKGRSFLKSSGKLLGNITYQADGFSARVFTSTAGKYKKLNTFNMMIVHNFGARFIHSPGHVVDIPQREYFALTDKEAQEVLNWIIKQVGVRMNKYL